MFLPHFSLLKKGSNLKNIKPWLTFDKYKQVIITFLHQAVFTLSYPRWKS